MAKPYREGSGWAVRVRVRGEDIYLSGFKTCREAEAAAQQQVAQLRDPGHATPTGPTRTTLAQAMLAYAEERLPFLKGARQDLQRMNTYLRLGDCETLAAHPLGADDTSRRNARVLHMRIERLPRAAQRRVVASLREHRTTQSARAAHSTRVRRELARTCMADISPRDVMRLVNAMAQDGFSASTIALEVAQLKRIFNHAAKVWLWTRPARNPAAGLLLPRVDNQRDRVMSRAEWRRICAALDEYGDLRVAGAVALLLETGMRSSEPLQRATWDDVDWSRSVLQLRDAKAGSRDVPLSPQAVNLLRAMQRAQPGGGQLIPLTYEALKAAWKRVCAAAEVEGLNLHDLRHTAATRFALAFSGNKFVLKAITGHKTDSQLERYVNVKADDVVDLMHERVRPDRGAAGLADGAPALLDLHPQQAHNVIQANFGRRSA